MLKRIAYLALALFIFGLVLWFTSMNSDTVTVDIFALGTVDTTVALALVVTFVLGWAFGVLSASFYVFRLISERRRLKTSLKNSESEVSSLRNLPIADAD